MAIDIVKADGSSDKIGEFIGEAFETYAASRSVVCDYKDFCFAAMSGQKIVGAITGHAYYKEIHIGDLIVSPECRGLDIGTALVRRVESEFEGGDYENINLTTYGFQALEFYKKLGYEVEYTRPSSDPKLVKYFLLKRLAQ